jgi:mitochondrial Rho GTPase 1
VNIAEAFHFAIKAVIHPSTPIYDASLQELRPKAARALLRIFRLLDR